MSEQVNNYRVSNNHYQEGPVYEEHYHTTEDRRTDVSAANHNYSPSHSRAGASGNRVALHVSQTQGSNTALLLVAGLFAVGGVTVLGVALLAAATVIAAIGGAVALCGGLLYYRTVTAPLAYRLTMQREQQEFALTMQREQHAHELARELLPLAKQRLALPPPPS